MFSLNMAGIALYGRGLYVMVTGRQLTNVLTKSGIFFDLSVQAVIGTLGEVSLS